jgi:anti-anti-sigma factor
LNELLETGSCEDIVLDFSRVALMASLALSMVFSLNAKLQSTGGRLVFCGLNPLIKELFGIVGLDEAFDVLEDETAALKAFAKQGPDPAPQA